MNKPSQLVFDLALPAAYRAEDFLPSPCNEDAALWIAHWPGWSLLALCGPEACGKSHLARIFAEKSGGVVIPAAELTVEGVPELAAAPSAIVEDGDRGVDEAALFHLYNLMKESGHTLVITGREAPARWKVALPDLRSRLATFPVAGIGSPDDALIEALLVKLFADRQLRIAPDLIGFLLPRIERSFAAVHELVDRLDQASLERGRAVTIPLVRQVLE